MNQQALKLLSYWRCVQIRNVGDFSTYGASPIRAV